MGTALLCTVPTDSGVVAPEGTETSDSTSMLFCDSYNISNVYLCLLLGLA
jgi:hypothetical protein